MSEIDQKSAAPLPPNVNKGKTLAIIVIGALILVALGVAVGFGINKLLSSNSSVSTSQHEKVDNDGNKIITAEEGDIASVVEKVGPSVVSIVTTATASQSYGRSVQQEGAGTGIIVGKDGFILTNKHVIDGAQAMKVILADGTTHESVRVLGTDPLNDIAFLKVDGVSNLPTVSLGDSASIRVGQRVVAIGNSLGQYQNTVTSGIISGVGRPISAQSGDTVETLTDLLQTDAAINPGNSGGPLLNLSGQVIGINTAIVEDAQGIGFAIPVNSTKGMLKGVLAGEPVKRAYLGVNFINITADVAKHYNLSVKKGAYVHSDRGTAITAGGPAAKAGIKDNDIIVKVGSVEIGASGGVSSLIGEYRPGDTVDLEVLRDGKTIVIKTTLGEYRQ